MDDDSSGAVAINEPVSAAIEQVSGEPVATDVAALKAQANIAQTEGRFEEAERLWLEVLAVEDGEGEALCGVAICLLSTNKGDKARAYVDRVVASNVLHYAPWLNLGAKLKEVYRYADSIDVYRSLARGYPDQGDVWFNLGLAELGARRPAAALGNLRRASRYQPTSAVVWCNLVLACLGLDRLPEALAASRRALAIEPASPVATFNMGAVLLAMGRLREGFAAYEHRFALGGAGWLRHDVKAAPWTGEDLAGRSVLVVGEQANGDQIMFSRYVPELARRGAKVTYMLPTRLHRLMSSLGAEITLREAPDADAHYDFQVPLLSLPHQCGVDEEGAFPVTPHLAAEPAQVEAWRTRIGDHGFRIGVAWQGHVYPDGNDLDRSFPVDALWPIAQIPGVRLISLQLGNGVDQLSRLPPGMAVEALGEDFDAGDHAFVDTAAVMANLDLVITLDSSIAHLAGALGRPVWLAATFAPEWRWQRGRTDSPWYPTMRLFRQRVTGDWDSVFHEMAEALVPLTRLAAPAQPAPSLDVPLVPVSYGELLDKISILEIKVERLPPPAAAAAGFELGHLLSTIAKVGSLEVEVEANVAGLKRVNSALWDVEDRLRVHEAEERFDAEFVALARSVYALNDERARLKRGINVALGSAIVEQKSYGDVPRASAGNVVDLTIAANIAGRSGSEEPDEGDAQHPDRAAAFQRPSSR